MTGNKIADKITKVSKTLLQSNSETITNEHDKEMPKNIYIYIYIQKKDRKLLMNWDWYNSIIMEYRKTEEATSDLIGNKITNKVTKVSRSSLQNNLETITNEYDKEIPKERCVSPEKRQKIIDDLTLI